jgi:hypothetical protein
MLLLLLSLFLTRLYHPLSSFESPPVVPDYTVKLQLHSSIVIMEHARPASSDEVSFDVSSSSFLEDVTSSPPVEPSSLIDSSLEQLVRHSHRLRRPPDYYSPSAFTAAALSDLASYRDANLHLEWQHAMAEEIAALEQTDTWNLVPCPPHVRPITCNWAYTVKTHSNGSLELCKARLIARGF